MGSTTRQRSLLHRSPRVFRKRSQRNGPNESRQGQLWRLHHVCMILRAEILCVLVPARARRGSAERLQHSRQFPDPMWPFDGRVRNRHVSNLTRSRRCRGASAREQLAAAREEFFARPDRTGKVFSVTSDLSCHELRTENHSGEAGIAVVR